MGIGRSLLALSPFCGPTTLALAQEPHPLALRAAELREANAGSMTEVENAVRGLLTLVQEDPTRAGEIHWEETLADLCVGAQARAQESSWCTFVVWQVALAWRDAGDVKRARELLEERTTNVLEDDLYGPRLWIELADFARFSGEWPRAEECLERACAALVPAGNEPFEFEPSEPEHALALGSWFDVAGQFYFELGRGEEAAVHYAEARARAQSLDDDALWWAAVDDQVRLALALGRLEEVETIWQAAQADVLWQRGQPGDRLKLDFSRGRALVDLEQRGLRVPGEARAILMTVAEDARSYEHDKLDAELQLATAALDAGELEEARAWIEAARERRVRSGAGAASASQERFALEALEWRLARASGDPDVLRRAHGTGREAFESFLTSWCETPLLAGGIGFLQTPWRNLVLSEWLELTLAVFGPEAGAHAAADLLRVQSCGTLTRSLSSPAADLAAVRAELLSAGQGALVFVPGRQRSLALALDGRAARLVPLPPGHELAAARHGLEECARLTVAGTESSLQVASSARATGAFLPPELWQAIAGWSEILVIGAEGAGLFAFEALEPEPGRPLGEIRAVSHLPSLQVGLALARRATTRPPARTLLVAPAAAGGDAVLGLEPLPFDGTHAERLAGSFEHCRVLRDAQATGAALGAALADLDAVSFVAHGLFEPRRVRPSGLLLADGDALWCELAENLPAPELVSLVACGVGRGPQRRGDDGGAHLGAAFLRAGARSVLLAQAELEYRFGHALDAHFHARLTAGDAPAEALRAARVAARAETGAPPIQGALVRLYGNGSRPCFVSRTAPSGSRWIFAVGAGTVLALGLGLGRRRALARG